MVRKKGVFVMELKAVNDRKGKPKRNTGGAMDIDKVEEDSEEETEDTWSWSSRSAACGFGSRRVTSARVSPGRRRREYYLEVDIETDDRTL